jgi:hypothetical protein
MEDHSWKPAQARKLLGLSTNKPTTVALAYDPSYNGGIDRKITSQTNPRSLKM